MLFTADCVILQYLIYVMMRVCRPTAFYSLSIVLKILYRRKPTMMWLVVFDDDVPRVEPSRNISIF